MKDQLYSEQAKNEPGVAQGDGIESLVAIDVQFAENADSFSIKSEKGPALIASNSCDIELSNRRILPIRAAHFPIIKLSQYEKFLSSKKNSNQIQSHINSIKNQKITSIFYLPANPRLQEDCIVLLDRITSCDLRYLHKAADGKKLFSLSQFGLYLFVIKLSIHFTRLMEHIERPVSPSARQA